MTEALHSNYHLERSADFAYGDRLIYRKQSVRGEYRVVHSVFVQTDFRGHRIGFGAHHRVVGARAYGIRSDFAKDGGSGETAGHLRG